MLKKRAQKSIKLSACCTILLLTGCATSNGLASLVMKENNVSNISRLTLGMDEGEVLQIMHSPYKQETLEVNGDLYDVWFYVTNPTGMGQTRMVHYNLTPLNFKNDVLVYVGWDYYKALKEGKGRIGQYPPSPPAPPPSQADQDALERALEINSSGKKDAPPPSQPSQSRVEKGAEPSLEKTPPVNSASDNQSIEQTLETAPAETAPTAPQANGKPAKDHPVNPVSEPKQDNKSTHPATTAQVQLSLAATKAEPPEDTEEEAPPAPSKKNPNEFDEDDEEMIHDEQTQDFNFW